MNTTTQAIVQKKPETAVENLPPKQASLIQLMAAKYSMEPAQYANAVKKTAMPGNATNEEFAAFLMIAHEYNLNPLLKEIYAFPKKGGGVAPMVSIDGWVNIINSNAKLEGFSFEVHHDDKNNLVACTCTMKRKDRSMPTVVTEYLAECIRNTEPWKMKYRMLRHKALIQAARYCFGLSGIYDEDEARDQEMKNITPANAPARPVMQDFVNPAPAQGGDGSAGGASVDSEASPAATDHDPETGEVNDENPVPDFGAADAMEMGRLAREQNRSYNSMPDDWRDGKNETFASAWQAGWNEEDAEIKKGGK
jgi:phage recombination protein Bet